LQQRLLRRMDVIDDLQASWCRLAKQLDRYGARNGREPIGRMRLQHEAGRAIAQDRRPATTGTCQTP
jgi:hypothetical protein